MKKILFYFVPVALFVLMLGVPDTVNAQTSAHKATTTGVKFQTSSWKAVLNLAKKENKLIFLDIYASWCPPCKLLKSETFPNKAVGDFFNAHFINFSVDAEKTNDGMMLAKKYAISAYPTLFFIDGNGKVVAQSVGFMKADELIQAGKEALAKRKK